MTYKDFLLNAQTGDILATCTNIFVRVTTGESYSHVAMLVWIKGELFVAEQHELHGFRVIPITEWVEGKEQFTFGQAPEGIRGNIKLVLEVKNYPKKRPTRYGWFVLLLVWLSQVTGIKFPRIHDVCSTFLAIMWDSLQPTFSGNPDPGTVVRKSCNRNTVYMGLK